MSQRENLERRTQRIDEGGEQSAAEAQDQRGALDADVDAILDEIDEVLEENAEDFVKSFVQKGGQ